jgi:hypothetical protein
MSLQDYKTRKYDLLAFQAPRGTPGGLADMALFNADTSGRIVTGVQKLSQRWALEFLTEQGSLQFLPNRGAPFMRYVKQGRLRTQSDVLAAFAESSLTITRNLRLEEYADMPTDEQFDSATLSSLTILPGYLNLRVMITSRAGDSRTIIVPIETLP